MNYNREFNNYIFHALKKKLLYNNMANLKLFVFITISSFYTFTAQLYSDESTTKNIKIICPPIECEERRRTNHPGESEHPICLVVMGKVKTIKRSGVSDGIFEVAVEKVLYGANELKSIRFKYPWNYVSGQRSIIALSPKIYGKVPFQFRYMAPVEDEASQISLSRARLDFAALSSKSIFIGKELSANNDYQREVQIVRHLHGPKLSAGEKITVIDQGYIRSNGFPAVRLNEMIYFIDNIAPLGRGKPLAYHLNSRIEIDQEEKVIAALKRRESYPIRELKDENGGTIQIREITFMGSLNQILKLMASPSRAVVLLGHRKLLRSGDSGRKMAVDTIKNCITKNVSLGHSESRQMHNLIYFLGVTKGGKEDVSDILDHMITHVKSGASAPKRIKISNRSEDLGSSILLWLFQALDMKQILSKYAIPFIKLRDVSKSGWKDEIQFALSQANVLDGLELTKAIKIGGKINPTQTELGFRITGEQVIFSHDGKGLLVDGSYYQISDWRKNGTVDAIGKNQVIYSPDSKYMYVLGYHQTEVAKIQWPEGKILKKLKGHKGRITSGSLSSDGKILMTISYYEDVAHIWNTATGKIKHSFTLNDNCFNGALSPDGKTVALQTNNDELAIMTVAGAKIFKINIGKMEINEILFSLDGKYLLVLSGGFAEGISLEFKPQLSVYNIGRGYSLFANLIIKDARNRGTAMVTSPDGKYIVIGNQEGRVWKVDFPTLKNPKRIVSDKSSGNIDAGEIAFSPDGKLLVVGARYGNIRIFNIDNKFEQIIIGNAHQGEVEKAFFSADGKSICTIGENGFVCHWDSKTLKLQRRFSMPIHTTVVGVRPFDGRIAFCASSADLDAPFHNRNPPLVKIVDLYTGKTIGHIDLPVNWSFHPCIHWCDQNKAIVVGDGKWWRINYLASKILNKRDIDISSESTLFNKGGEVVEDGKSIFMWDRSHGKLTTRKMTVWSIDVENGKATDKLVVDQKIKGGYNDSGLIPGGKYFYVADPDMYILSRKTGKLVHYRSFGKSDILNITFSPDGSKYAVITGGRIFIDDSLQKWDPNTKSIVRIHETLTGKTLMAFPSPIRWAKAFRFSPDGKNLLVVGKNMMKIWPIIDSK